MLRGLTIALMILVDDLGDTYHSIDHSPWNGIRLADFVFPFFLWIVGVSIVLAFRKSIARGERSSLVRKSVKRAVKLFCIGLFVQGGTFPNEEAGELLGLPDIPGGTLSYEFDLFRIRIPGILQRIAWGFLVAALVEVFLRPSEEPDTYGETSSTYTYFYIYIVYAAQWLAFLALTGLYLGLMFGIDVPGCGRGHITEQCNAAYYLDHKILGNNHMYQTPTYIRSDGCSTCYPAFCPRVDPKPYCSRAFDPEGILTSMSAATSALLGLAFGHVLVHERDHWQRLRHWVPMSLVCAAVGTIIHFAGFPWNKNLWTTSYVFFMAGVAGGLLSLFYLVIDIYGHSFVFQPLRVMGMNAIFVFTMAAANVFDTLVTFVYWKKPENNIISHTIDKLGDWTDSHDTGVLIYVLLKIAFWFAVSGVLHWRRIYFKV